ncbi:MAG: CDP-alcohol phosphatidyltransferase family protein [Deltaproteobacteria bacterium]
MGRWGPNLLCWLRIALGPAFALALGAGGVWPLALVSTAALTDFFDGRLARRAGIATRGGLYLDVAADGIFLLTALVALASQERISWLMPCAVTIALSALAWQWSRRQPGDSPVRGLADRVGHTAGVANYGLVFAAAAAPLVGLEPRAIVILSLAMAVFNLAPLALRLLKRP